MEYREAKNLLKSVRLEVVDDTALVCCHGSCRFALSPSPAQVTEHLRKRHDVPAEKRRQVTGALRALEKTGVLVLSDTKSLQPRADGSPLDARLQHLKGLLCKHCDFRTISRPTLVNHVGARHPATPTIIRGGAPDIYTPVLLQSWVRNPTSSRYWTVRDVDGLGPPEEEEPPTTQYVQQAIAREAARQTAATSSRLDAEARSYTEMRPWLERTGWERAYAGVDRQLLRALTSPPSPRRSLVLIPPRPGVEAVLSPTGDEEKLAVLASILTAVIARAEDTARTSGRTVLSWLYSVHPMSCHAKPFRLVAKRSTRSGYIAVLRRFICMVFRVYRLAETGQNLNTGISLTPVQRQAVRAVWKHYSLNGRDGTDDEDAVAGAGVRAAMGIERDNTGDSGLDARVEHTGETSGAEDEGGGCPYSSGSDTSSQHSDSDGDSDSDSDAGTGSDAEVIHWPQDILQDQALHELLFGLVIMFCQERAPDGDPSRVLLVYFVGILAFTPDLQSFRPPRNFTTHLAALVYLQRILFLEYAIPAHGYRLLGISPRSTYDRLDRLQKVRRRHLVYGCESSFDELFSLMCYGRKAAADGVPATLLFWDEDGETVSVGDGLTVTMREFRALPRYLIEEAGRTCRELLFGISPGCNLSRYRDSFTETRHGFSFVQHPSNDLSQQYLRLCQEASNSGTSSLSSQKGWRWARVLDYTRKAKTLLELLAVLMLLTGGGPPRGPDLLHIRSRNAGTAERGIYIHNGALLYLTRSHKAKRSTNREFYVARILPYAVGEILFSYLVYIRPFTDMLAKEQDPSLSECSSYLFRDGPSPTATPWSTARLSSILRRATSAAWPKTQGTTVQLLRQLCVGITEKHVREVHRPFNLYDDHSTDADRGVLFAWQTGHRPLQRAQNYGLDGSFPSRLQPALLARYQWTSACWHEFLGLSDGSDDQGVSGSRAKRGPEADLDESARRKWVCRSTTPTESQRLGDAIHTVRLAVTDRNTDLNSYEKHLILEGLAILVDQINNPRAVKTPPQWQGTLPLPPPPATSPPHPTSYHKARQPR